MNLLRAIWVWLATIFTPPLEEGRTEHPIWEAGWEAGYQKGFADAKAAALRACDAMGQAAERAAPGPNPLEVRWQPDGEGPPIGRTEPKHFAGYDSPYTDVDASHIIAEELGLKPNKVKVD